MYVLSPRGLGYYKGIYIRWFVILEQGIQRRGDTREARDKSPVDVAKPQEAP